MKDYLPEKVTLDLLSQNFSKAKNHLFPYEMGFRVTRPETMSLI